MYANSNNAIDRSGGYTCLDTIRMSEHERRHARESLRDGELVADLLLRAAADMGAVARYVETAAASLARGIKTILAKPVP